jgi:hypothetical protein
MATIKREVALSIDAGRAWRMIGDFGNAAKAFAGVLVACERSGNTRTVTFANGLKVTEQLVTCDDTERRYVYTVLNGAFTQHSASMQIIPTNSGCRFVWISDFLPDEATEKVLPLVEAGCHALHRNC